MRLCPVKTINSGKSELILIEEVLNLEDLVGALGCEVGAFLTTYLGLLSGAPFMSSRDLGYGGKRISEKLSNVEGIVSFKRWKVNFDGVHFIQLIDLLHVYLVILKRLVFLLENIQRDFLWGAFGTKVARGELVYCFLREA